MLLPRLVEMGDELICLARFQERQKFGQRLLRGLELLDDCRAVNYRVISRCCFAVQVLCTGIYWRTVQTSG
jgi:hypothetical protein